MVDRVRNRDRTHHRGDQVQDQNQHIVGHQLVIGAAHVMTDECLWSVDMVMVFIGFETMNFF